MIKIGIDVGGTTLKLGVVENDKEIIYRDTRPSIHDPEAIAQRLYEMIVDARAKFPGAPAAISIAGLIDEEGNVDANQLNFWHAPVGPLLFEKLGEKVMIENDGISALLAEYRAGALKGCESGVMLTFGTGIGGGAILDGKPLRGFRAGKSRANAELGHIITHVGGVQCSCGQTGCWESYASCTALSQMAGGLTPREILERVRKGEMTDLWDRYIHEVCQGILSLCSVFFPQVVAIGGGLSNAGDIFIGRVQKELENVPNFRVHHPETRIVSACFLNDAGILGAAALI